MTRHRAVVALGANLGARAASLAAAVDQLAGLGRVDDVSPLYETAPVGGPDQPSFLNAVAVVTTLVQDPKSFLDGLHALEDAHDRVRAVRWGPRSLDLDLVAWDDAVVEGDVVVPHPRAAERRFVLQPLADVDPDFAFPDGRTVGDLLPTVADQVLERYAPRGWWASTRPVEGDERLDVVVAGPGRAGTALADALALAGHRIVVVVSRSGNDAGSGAPAIGWSDPLPSCDLVLLTVPDRALTAAVTTIAPNLPDGATVVHCSGITPLSVLGPLATAGHPIGALHPLASMPTGAGADAVRGAGMAVAGSDEATIGLLETVARSMSGEPFRIEDDQRAAYHGVASMVANHMTAVLGAAEEVADGAGLPFDRYALLAEGAARLAFGAGGPAAALTGPIARGDEGTVAAQRAAVEAAAPEVLPLFDALNDASRRLVDRR